jgi:ABC-type transport system involved in multi-copper enzyme maturation permease subunit
MTSQKKNKDIPKSFWLILMSIPVLMFGILGGLLGLTGKNPNFLSGFLWGISIGVALFIVSGIGYVCWEWIKKEADKGKLLPFLLIGFIAAIAISGLLAVNLGKPSCEDSGDAPYSSCTQYADDGYETTSNQKWNKFWGSLPVTVIITSLVAVIVRNEMEKSKKK